MKMRSTLTGAGVIGIVLLAVSSAYGAKASGTATLGTDERAVDNEKKVACPADFGFAFLSVDDAAGARFTDTCQTNPKPGDARTLRASDGVASPEKDEPILASFEDNTVIFYGRTNGKGCYYMVTGVWEGGAGVGGVGGIGPAAPAKPRDLWHSEFDPSKTEGTPHYVLYVNERYASHDDTCVNNNTAKIGIEIHNVQGLAAGAAKTFTLRERALTTGASVDFLKDDGTVAPAGFAFTATVGAVTWVTIKGKAIGRDILIAEDAVAPATVLPGTTIVDVFGSSNEIPFITPYNGHTEPAGYSRIEVVGGALHIKVRPGPGWGAQVRGWGTLKQIFDGTAHADTDSGQVVVLWQDAAGAAIGAACTNATPGTGASWTAVAAEIDWTAPAIPGAAVKATVLLVYTDIIEMKRPRVGVRDIKWDDLPMVMGSWVGTKGGGWSSASFEPAWADVRELLPNKAGFTEAEVDRYVKFAQDRVKAAGMKLVNNKRINGGHDSGYDVVP